MNLSDQTDPPNPNDDGLDSADKLLDKRIEQALISWFTPQHVPAAQLAELQSHFQETHVSPRTKRRKIPATNVDLPSRRTLLIVMGALAAMVLVALAVPRLMPQPDQQIVFHRRPLTSVYSDLVARGFQPYYVCDDQQRFQETMQHRHGQTLALNDRGDRLMLGLSYPGGWTSETTAILFRHQGEPVVIFVDSQPFVNDEPATVGKLKIRLKQLAGVYMVEVSPLSESLLDTISPPAAIQ
ncbi:MAG: hypothetical protein IT423_23505 [Pirellulaceae bacterium]|nr:hypothetical protein [Pirellulaceae bacterium]